MTATDTSIDWFTASFDPICLEVLNEKAAMMQRIDNKYVLHTASLARLIPDLSAHFDVLDIEGTRAFRYDTRYFDDPDCSAYYEHHKGIRKRFKVRARRYVDAGLCFLEVKVKGQRDMTEKYRMPYDPDALGHLTPEAQDFARQTYADQYSMDFGYDLRPSLDNSYRRITLVARNGGERLTIDTDLSFKHGTDSLALGTGTFIVETKSSNGRGFADVLLRRAGERPINKCSKYCLGMIALGRVHRYNRFLPTLRKLGMVKASRSKGHWSEISSDLSGETMRPSSISGRVAA